MWSIGRSSEPPFRAVPDRRISSTLRLIVVGMLLGGLLPLSSQSASAVDPVSLSTAATVPADVAMFLAVEADQSSPQGLLAQELLARAGAPEADDALSTIAETGVAVDSSSVEEIMNLPGGEIAIVLQTLDFAALGGFEAFPVDEFGELETDSLETALPAGMAVVVTSTNMATALPEFEAMFRQDALDAGGTVEESLVDGARVLTVSGLTTGSSEFGTMAVLDDFVYLASTVDDLQPFFDAAQGEIPNLAANVEFQQVLQNLPAELLVVSYAPAPAAAYYTAAEDALRAQGIAFSYEMLFGDTGYGSYGFAMSADPAGLRFNTVQLPAPGGSFAPAGTATELTFAEQVPGGTLFMANGFDLGNSLGMRALEQMLVAAMATVTSSDVTPVVPEMTQTYLDQQYEAMRLLLGFNLQTDFLHQLEGQYGLAVTGVDLINPSNIGMVFVSDLADPVAVANAVRSVGSLIQAAAQGEAIVSTATIGTESVSQVTVPADTGDMTIQYGVIGDQFVLGMGNAVVEYSLGSPTTLASSPVYLETLSYLPAEFDSLVFVDVPQILEVSIGAMTSVVTDVESGFVDNSARCAEFVTQEDAQAAYDEDPVANFDLDLDFDDVACDDHFSSAGASTNVAAFSPDLGVNVGGMGVVTYQENGLMFSSGILVVPDEQ